MSFEELTQYIDYIPDIAESTAGANVVTLFDGIDMGVRYVQNPIELMTQTDETALNVTSVIDQKTNSVGVWNDITYTWSSSDITWNGYSV